MSATVSAPRRSRFWLYAPFAALALFCIVWSGFWFYGRMKIIEVMDSAIARAASQGQNITCPERTIGGFPFRMELVCASATFAMTTPEGPFSLGVERLVVNARALDPTAVIAVLDGPMTFSTPNGDGSVDWSEGRLSARASGLSLGSIDVVLKDVSIVAPKPDGSGDVLNASFKAFEGHLRQRPGSAAEGRADFDLVAKLEGVASPDAAVLDVAPPLDVELQLTATRVPLQPRERGPAAIDAWRDAGGGVNVVLARTQKGDIAAEAIGDLKLDAGRMLEGKLNLSFNGLDRLAEPLGLEVPGMALALMKNGKAPITLSKGRAALGPIPLAFLKPLY